MVVEADLVPACNVVVLVTAVNTGVAVRLALLIEG